jgi:D-alanyl-D-alanine carboxypeptidase
MYNFVDFYVKVTESASRMIGTTAELKVNTWIKIWDLLYGTMLPSGNDAAYLLS